MSNLFYLLPFLLFLSGCMVGPNYHPPIECLPNRFAEERTEELDPCTDEELAHWWTFFNDPFLDALLEESLQGSFDWRIALEKVCQARAAFWVQTTALFPELDSDLQITRSRMSENLRTTKALDLPPIQNFYQTGVDAIWQIDLFGGLRRASRAAYDIWQATVEEARGARIVLLSEVSITYTHICALQQIYDVALRTIRLDEDLLALSETRFQAGIADEQEIETARATLEADRAHLLVIEINLKQTIYSLSVLLGRPPESFLEQFAEVRPIPSAIRKVPIGLPSDLLRRRPDIRSAERRIAASVEQIGVAVANLFPQLALTGSTSSYSANPLQGANAGFTSNSFKNWFSAPSRVWGLGGLVTWPFLDFGKRWAIVKEQVSLEHQAFLIYEKTVITALQEVESDLIAYFNEEERLTRLMLEVQANHRKFDLISDLYRAGLADFSQVLDAEGVWLTSLTDQITSEQALTTNLIALYKALGGGWECSYMP